MFSKKDARYNAVTSYMNNKKIHNFFSKVLSGKIVVLPLEGA